MKGMIFMEEGREKINDTQVRETRKSSRGKWYTHRFPTDVPFFFPLWLTMVFILLPCFVITWQLYIPEAVSYGGEVSLWKSSQSILFGNWISPFILWFFSGAMVYLFMKRKALRNEIHTTDVLAKEIVPQVFDRDVHTRTSEQLYQLMEQKLKTLFPKARPENLLLNRFLIMCNRKVSNTLEKEDENIHFAGQCEHSEMQSSYSLPRFMVWAIPILGFIGTVWGISRGISNFAIAMNDATSSSEISNVMQTQLSLVTAHLGTAFDTTFLALVLSIPLMLLLTWTEKKEEHYITSLDTLWFHDLLPRFTLTRCMSADTTHKGTQSASDSSRAHVQVVADEIKLLSTQVNALHKIMEDFYETVFASSQKK
jgi:biopolymer transport protein ExbB/TolQ